MNDMYDDWYPPELDGPQWVPTGSLPCPRCECCTQRLCDQARAEGVHCRTLRAHDPGMRDVTGCPCTRQPTATTR